MKLIKFPSIEQFRSTIYAINHHYNYIGKDENDEPMFDISKEKPTLTFNGTIKLHGTCASICYNDYNMWVQSRKQIITPLKDNAGFAFFVESKEDFFIDIFKEIKEKNNIDTSKNTISLYGEWAGTGIQNKVAICNIPKTFFIFGIKISEILEENSEETGLNYWVDCSGYKNNEHRIYNINDFKTYTIDIDFNHPELSQNKIIEQTLEVEDECPVAKEFGFIGLGEGIVYTYIKPDTELSDQTIYRFKSKGLLHSKSSKVKTLKPVDNDKINKLREMAERVTPEWRLEQSLNEVCDLNNGGEIERRKIPDFIRSVLKDIVKEEMDILVEAGIEPKQINKYVSDISRKYFFNQEKV